MELQELPCIFIRSPDRGKTSSLGGHYIDSISVVRIHLGNARSHKLHHLIFNISVFKYSSYNGQGNILRPYKRGRLSVEIHCDHLGTGNVICVAKKLFYKFTAALSDCHRTESAISGVAVGTENHFPAAGHHLSHILVNYGNVRRHVDTAVFLCRRQTKYVIIFIDCTAYGTQGIVAVCKHVGQGKTFHSRCNCRLNNSDKCNVMGCHTVKTYFKILHRV